MRAHGLLALVLGMAGCALAERADLGHADIGVPLGDHYGDMASPHVPGDPDGGAVADLATGDLAGADLLPVVGGTADLAGLDLAVVGPGPDLASADLAVVGPGPDLAPPPDLAIGPDLSHPVSCSASQHLVINELKTGGSATANDEFIEIYNPCALPVDMTGWKLGHRAAQGTSENTIVQLSGTISGNGYWLVASDSCGCVNVADQTYGSGTLAAAGGGVGLRDGTGAIVDSVGYGAGTNNAFVEDQPAPAPPVDESTARHPNGQDTNHNQNDFVISATPTPRAPNP
jgi:hypothetical protein